MNESNMGVLYDKKTGKVFMAVSIGVPLVMKHSS